MKRIPGWLFLLLPVMILVTGGCNSVTSRQEVDKMITVSILPQKYFVDQLAGNRFEVNVMIPPGASPVTYEPSPKQIQKIGNSMAYLRIGHIVFEKVWMDKIQSANPELQVFDQSEHVELIRHETGHTHSMGQGHGRGVDPHIWLSPGAVKAQVKNIKDMLIELDSANIKEYQNNYQAMISRIDSLDAQINKTLEDIDNRSFLIFHPALSYFARAYQLEQVAVQHEGKEPSPARLRNLIDEARKKNIRAVLIQEQFSTDEAQTLAEELNAEVIQVDPLAYNWMENMMTIARKMQKALKGA